MNHTEHDEQAEFFRMLQMLDCDAAVLTFAVPNGARMVSARHAKRMVEEGMRKGVPDIICAMRNARQDYAGLAIEMKAGRNKSTPDQERWQKRLMAAGWKVDVCYSARDAFLVWESYVELDERSRDLIRRNFFYDNNVVGGA